MVRLEPQCLANRQSKHACHTTKSHVQDSQSPRWHREGGGILLVGNAFGESQLSQFCLSASVLKIHTHGTSAYAHSFINMLDFPFME